MSGSIPLLLPSGITSLYLGNNRLTGTIPTVLPVGLATMFFDSNNLGGDLPLFPLTLRFVYLGFPGRSRINRFTGTLRLNNPVWLFMNDNWITDVIIQDSSGLITYCDLSNNPLLGNSNIAGLTGCARNGLYSPALLNSKTTSTIIFSTQVATQVETQAISSLEAPITTNLVVHIDSTMSTSLDLIASVSVVSKNSKQSHSNFESSTVATVQFDQNIPLFVIDFEMVLKLFLNWSILLYVLKKTPFIRELKKWMKKGSKFQPTNSVSL